MFDQLQTVRLSLKCPSLFRKHDHTWTKFTEIILDIMLGLHQWQH